MGNSPKSMKNLVPGTVAVLGVPFDENSSFMRGPAKAPARIREVLNAGSANMCTENVFDLAEESRFQDLGDMVFVDKDSVFDDIADTVKALIERKASVLCLGGDHSITYPILRAYGKRFDNLTILHLDAHPDLYDEYEGNRHSNACPFARIMEEKLSTRLVQIGIRTMNPHQRAQAERFGVEVVEMKMWHKGLAMEFSGPVYLSLDMDVLDPAFAPGVSHHEPGGLSTREVISLIQGLNVPIIGGDIVEFNPSRDPVGITAMAAAKLLKEIAGKMLCQGME